MQKQSDIIKQLSDKELTAQLYISQTVLLLTGLLVSLFLFDHVNDWFNQLAFKPMEITYYGFGAGFIIVGIDCLLMTLFPARMYDDGGINKRIFQNRPMAGIVLLTLFVAISEEILFRGVIQSSFGYMIASSVFALIHVRYLTKPVLFISVLFVSFYIGYIYELTNNLLVTITAHFTVDCLLGLFIRFRKWSVSK